MGAIYTEEEILKELKDTYWRMSDKEDFDVLYNSLSEFLGLENPSEVDLRATFFQIDAITFGQGISFGFNDTEVRDKIYTMIRDNKETIKDKILLHRLMAKEEN